jgi:hypothetical protein
MRFLKLYHKFVTPLCQHFKTNFCIFLFTSLISAPAASLNVTHASCFSFRHLYFESRRFHSHSKSLHNSIDVIEISFVHLEDTKPALRITKS